MVAISRAVAVRAAIGRIARPATAKPASAARTRAAQDAEPRKSHSLPIVLSRLAVLRAYWT